MDTEKEIEYTDEQIIGDVVNIPTALSLLDMVIKTNKMLERKGHDRMSFGVLGNHGIGKSKSIEHAARERGMDFISFAISQASEFGDMIGKPYVEDGVTKYHMPNNMPKETENSKKNGGILLIDDINRGGSDVLQGCLDFVQNYRTVGWEIPPNWTIAVTANPDNGVYLVSQLDDPMIDRIAWCTLKFDINPWIGDLTKKGYEEELINFVKQESDSIEKMVLADESPRTTARSITQFFNIYQAIDLDKRKGKGFVKMVCNAKCNDVFTNLFMKYHGNNLIDLPNVNEIMTGDWEQSKEKLSSLFSSDTQRASISSIIMDRIKSYCTMKQGNLDVIETENIINMLIYDKIPVDSRTKLRDKFLSNDKIYETIITDPRVYELL